MSGNRVNGMLSALPMLHAESKWDDPLQQAWSPVPQENLEKPKHDGQIGKMV